MQGLDERKVLSMVQVLLSNPDGLWLRQLPKEAQLAPSTVSRYLDTVLASLVEDTPPGGQKPFLRVVNLKPFVIRRLEAGQNLADIMRVLRLVRTYS